MSKARRATKKKAASKAAKKSAPKKKKVAPIPAGYYSVTPYLICRGAAKAIDFYKRAFGAKERLRMAEVVTGLNSIGEKTLGSRPYGPRAATSFHCDPSW